ncbi:MAG: DUF4421 family protein [Prevotella sp.]|nr:DUF4421 family protein [Prevotella sp.]
MRTIKKKHIVIAWLLTGCMQMQAQEQKPWVLRVLNAVKTYIDSSAVKGIDTRYLEVPEKPWAVVLKSNINDMDLRSTTYMTEEQLAMHNLKGEVNFEAKFKPDREVSIGAWIGYRGYGLGYSYSLQRSKGRNFSIGATGANYGFNLRIRSFSTDELSAHYWGYDEDGPMDQTMDDVQTWDDVKIKSSIFDAFYFLNGKHFSYAAAYDQSMNQIRSAGSLMLGVKWFQTSVDYSKPLNGLLIQYLGDVGRFKIHKANIGVGYAFNWVPMRNLLVNVMVMPMLTVYNRTKLYYYESNYDIFMSADDESHKGKKAVPDDTSWTEDITLKESGTEIKYGNPSFMMDARASLTYQFSRYFLTVSGQYSRYSNKADGNELNLTDWYVNAALGVRF